MATQKGFTPRNVSPLIQAIRNFLLGREHTPERSALRYAPLVSKRDQPPPEFPPGETHQIAHNPYCLRDARREVVPPATVAINTSKKLLAPGKDGQLEPIKSNQPKYPGQVYRWD